MKLNELSRADLLEFADFNRSTAATYTERLLEYRTIERWLEKGSAVEVIGTGSRLKALAEVRGDILEVVERKSVCLAKAASAEAEIIKRLKED